MHGGGHERLPDEAIDPGKLRILLRLARSAGSRRLEPSGAVDAATTASTMFDEAHCDRRYERGIFYVELGSGSNGRPSVEINRRIGDSVDSSDATGQAAKTDRSIPPAHVWPEFDGQGRQ